MNIFKVALLLLTGASIGVGIEQLAAIDNDTQESPLYEDYMIGGCHGIYDIEDHVLAHIPEEYHEIVLEKLEELYSSYDVVEGEVFSFELRQDIMDDLFAYLEENEIPWEVPYEEFSYHHHGMRHYYNEGE